MSWQAEAIIKLVRLRYPDWDGFQHVEFVQDEVAPKRKTQARWANELNQTTFADLLAAGEADHLLARLIKVGRSSSLLFSSVPKRGDLRLLFDTRLHSAEYLTQLSALLYDDAPLDERFARYCVALARADLPNTWAWVSFCLFMTQPQTAMFVKPRAAKWFMQFMAATYESRPNPNTYHQINTLAQQLLQDFAPYKPHDLIDIQSVVWIAFRESHQLTGNLDPLAQIELGQPPSSYEHVHEPEGLQLAETAPPYIANPVDQMEQTPIMKSLRIVAETVAYSEEQLTIWLAALRRKGQLIFYGSPGTGKTFLARQLADYLTGGGDGFTEVVQFHANYAYEDFVQGIRPIEQDGRVRFEQVAGQFMRFCERAQRCHDTCVLVIDEINRANVAQVLGELLLGLEYRAQPIVLAGGGRLSIPANVLLIGTMNTADRSLALVDFALRRRFAFVEIGPNYDLLRHFHKDGSFAIEALIQLLQKLNAQIEPAFQIGVSYFLDSALETTLSSIWQLEIEPYLAEYFFDQPQTAAQFRWEAVRKLLS